MVLYRFISRNEYKGAYKITDEEKLLEVIDELKDYLEQDLAKAKRSADEDQPQKMYPKFSSELTKKSDEFKGANDYRRLCCVKSFMLGLVLISRARQHYTHASWFRITALGGMIGVHGGVRHPVRSGWIS